MMKFYIGQQIRYLNAAGTATVKGVRGSAVVVSDEYGFDHEYDAQDLLPLDPLEIGEVHVKDGKKQTQGISAQQVERLVVDLHAHELLESVKGMSKYDILNHQIHKARELVSEARRRKVPKVLIIHGKGTGRLKDEVHQLLSKMGAVEYYFADFADGGYGATEVRILSSKH